MFFLRQEHCTGFAEDMDMSYIVTLVLKGQVKEIERDSKHHFIQFLSLNECTFIIPDGNLSHCLLK